MIGTAQTELREAVREAATDIAKRHPRAEWLRLARQGRHLEAMWADLLSNSIVFDTALAYRDSKRLGIFAVQTETTRPRVKVASCDRRNARRNFAQEEALHA